MGDPAVLEGVWLGEGWGLLWRGGEGGGGGLDDDGGKFHASYENAYEEPEGGGVFRCEAGSGVDGDCGPSRGCGGGYEGGEGSPVEGR